MNSLPDIVRIYQGPSVASKVSSVDPWTALKQFTPARIAMGRTGGSQRTASLLDFRLAHARARDAVHSVFHPEKIEEQLDAAGFEHVRATSMVKDKLDYLLHPENGRRLSGASTAMLRSLAPSWGVRDVAIVISDGLSATAAESHAVATAKQLREELGEGWTYYPVTVVPFGRVKIGDAISDILQARLVIILLGERPGLGSPDSLSAYFTFNARNSSVDSDRNCVSNIRPLGMPILPASRKLAILMQQSFQLKCSGTGLKDRIAPEQLLQPVPHQLPAR